MHPCVFNKNFEMVEFIFLFSTLLTTQPKFSLFMSFSLHYTFVTLFTFQGVDYEKGLFAEGLRCFFICIFKEIQVNTRTHEMLDSKNFFLRLMSKM